MGGVFHFFVGCFTLSVSFIHCFLLDHQLLDTRRSPKVVPFPFLPTTWFRLDLGTRDGYGAFEFSYRLGYFMGVCVIVSVFFVWWIGLTLPSIGTVYNGLLFVVFSCLGKIFCSTAASSSSFREILLVYIDFALGLSPLPSFLSCVPLCFGTDLFVFFVITSVLFISSFVWFSSAVSGILLSFRRLLLTIQPLVCYGSLVSLNDHLAKHMAFLSCCSLRM